MNLFAALQPPTLAKQAVQAAKTFRETQGTTYVKVAAALVKTAFEVSGKTDEPGYRIYSGLLAQPDITPGKLKLAQIGLQCFGKAEKQATAAWVSKTLGAAKDTLGATTAAIPEAASVLALASGAFGSALGGGAWAIQRALTKDEKKLRELEIQRDTYNRLATEVRDELRRRKLAPTPANQAAVIDYLT